MASACSALADRLGVVAVLGGQHRGRAQRPAGQLVLARPGQGQEPGQPVPADGEPAADQPPAPQGSADVQAEVDVGVLVSPVQRDVQVGHGRLEPAGPVGRVRAGQSLLAPGRDRGEVQRVPPRWPLVRRRLLELQRQRTSGSSPAC